ncbi:NAD(P)H-dependent oxidoreductase [Sorangium sp. So ce1335]|uniref:NAD(P)H-dependent oxidoreductase n=1 Tax=Sorangium sp. So ce1335 TaxID=3133335 RepID=UPI003F63979A
MNILIVFAHPEPRSLNGALRDRMVATLTAAGHDVLVSDLYAQGWKATLDGADFPAEPEGARLQLTDASHRAFASGAQTPDVAEEQRRLLWAHAVILQFPLWWFSMPAILKGWVERVFAHGFAYGVGEHSDRRWGDRYGEGVFAGKRAMLVLTAGGWVEHYAERGINGPMDDLLFPIQHGILFYPGFSVLEPFVVYRAERMNEERFRAITTDLDRRLERLFVEEPIPYRRQNHGDYEIPSMRLKEGLGAGKQGLRLHRA